MAEIVQVKIADLEVVESPNILKTVALGSGLAVILYDRKAKVAAMAHVIFPTTPRGKKNEKPGKYVKSAIENMISSMKKLGSSLASLEAKLVGGATMFSIIEEPVNIGRKNIETAKRILNDHGIKVVAEDTGADYGRSVQFYTDTGIAEVKSYKCGVKEI